MAILGYSLGDFNLNSILNEVKNSKNESFRRTEIYYVTKDSIADVIEKFYSMTYGIKAIQNTDTNMFFDYIEKTYGKAKDLIDSVEDLKDVIAGTHYYTDDFLKLKLSLTNILLQASSLGIDSRNKAFLKTLISLLEKKRQFTRENNAWAQYEHLADWLIEIASIITIKGSEFEQDFCEIAVYSLSYASKESYRGYSWHAWQAWRNRWHEMKLENQIMLEDVIKTNSWSSISEVPAILD